MDNKMSLKTQFQSMKAGDVMLTDARRAAVFVTAKRAGVKVSTCEVDGQTQVTICGEPEPEFSPVEKCIADLKALVTADRQIVFDEFELCCGMNRGSCICPDEPEPVKFGKSVDSIASLPKAEKLDALRALMSGTVPVEAEPVAEDWRFDPRTKPMFPDDGRVYRRQLLAPAFKKSRNVEVDEDDHERIIKVC